MVRSALESELKEIIRERDELCLDRFDRIIEAAEVIDLKEPCTVDAVLDRLNPVLALRGLESPLNPEALNGKEPLVKFVEIFSGIGVAEMSATRPDAFDVILIRSRDGLRFPGADAPIHALFFFLVGSNEQDFHLKAVAALAQVLQDPQFDVRWRHARNAQALKDLIVLADRRRVCSLEPRPWELDVVPDGQSRQPT